MLSVTQREAMIQMHELAHEICDGRWVALGGGGYELINVVPGRGPTFAAIAGHRPVPLTTTIPDAWNEHVDATFGRPGPRRMGDFAEGGICPAVGDGP